MTMFRLRNIKCLYLKSIRRIKGFLLSDKSREFLIFLFFYFIASAFWLLQTLNNDYETEFSIPVRLRGVPDNVMLTTEPPAEIKIKVKDKGTVLLNYMLGKSFLPVTLNFPLSKTTSSRVKVNWADIEKQVTGQLGASTRLLAVNPDTLEYYFSTGKSKKVPVRLIGKLTPARQYYISDTLFSPDSVLVYAPPFILDTLTAAYTQRLNLTGMTDTLIHHISLSKVKGAKFVPDQLKMVLPIDLYTEKTVEVPVRGINFPADKVLRTFPSKVQLTFQVGVSRFKSINADDFVLNVSYEELLHLGGKDKYAVKIKSVPRGASHVRIYPPAVDFLIEQATVYEY